VRIGRSFRRRSKNATASSHPTAWLAYESEASGRFEVYVRPFPNVGDGQWQVSPAGGHQPLWTRSGGELLYFAPDGALMAVPAEARSTAWSASAPAKILEPRYFTGGLGAVTTGRTYDVSPDGRRFLMIKQGDGGNQTSTPPQIIVVQNLVRGAPAPRAGELIGTPVRLKPDTTYVEHSSVSRCLGVP
jgi:hypothetical protein